MTAATGTELLPPAPSLHEHVWQLNVEYDGGLEIRERLCTQCSAVLSDA